MTTTAELLRKYVEYRLSDVRVAIPGRVESYDESNQTAQIQPLIKYATEFDDDTDPEVVDLPKLVSVPVVFPRAGGFFISFPVTKGDTGQLVICDRNIDQWRRKGDVVDPVDLRKHTLNGAVFYPGLSDDNSALSDAHASNLVIGKDGGIQIHIKPGGEIHIGSENAADYVALAAKVLTELNSIVTQVNAIVTLLNAEAALVGTYVPLVPASSVAATKTKAD